MSSDNKVRVQVSGPVESKNGKSIGVLVDLIFDEKGKYNSASRLEWFPKSLCELEKKEITGSLPDYFLTAPEWLLKTKNVKYEKQQ